MRSKAAACSGVYSTSFFALAGLGNQTAVLHAFSVVGGVVVLALEDTAKGVFMTCTARSMKGKVLGVLGLRRRQIGDA